MPVEPLVEEPRSREGQLLNAKYKLIKRLAAGGMGEVYKAENEVIGRPVAIKVLLPEHAKNPTLVMRFLTEARAANIVRHPNVVDVLDIGQAEDGTPFIVQELLEGTDLARWAREAGGQLSVDQTLRVLVPVVEAVGTAHGKGVVHRDIKPENVFLARLGPKEIVPKLLDFGISRVRRETPDSARLTSMGVGMGTPAYMSPEQVMSTRDADAASDVWSFGVMLYELLSGQLPFHAETAGAMFVKIATEEPVPIEELLPELPRDLVRIIARSMKKKPGDRYPSASSSAAPPPRRSSSRSSAAGRFGASSRRSSVASRRRSSWAPRRSSRSCSAPSASSASTARGCGGRRGPG
jgi:serine/threonine-protein kinase